MAWNRMGRAGLLAAILGHTAAQKGQYIEIPFSQYTIGPDGPWLGVEVQTNFGPFPDRPLERWVMIPYGGAYSQFVNTTTYTQLINTSVEYFGAGQFEGSAFFTEVNSTLATGWNVTPAFGTNNWPSQDWFTTQYEQWGNLSSPVDDTGDYDFENATLLNVELATSPGDGVQQQTASTAIFNTSLVFWDNEALFSIKNGTAYQPSAPLLGLGGTSQGSTLPGQTLWGATGQVRKNGVIAAEFFALHIGSATENINGSLYLGGYDANRVLGKTGVFGFQQLDSLNAETFWPQVPLVDVKMGTEIGGSAFNFTDYERSVWGSANISQADSTLSKQAGGPSTSCLVSPNPAAPYIKMPPGVCSTIASYLPVTYNNDFGYYLWNTQDPAYQKIVRSPAFLDFVLQDIKKQNTSIKVPFALLNLTLEAPLNNGTKLQYFPCVDVDTAEDGPASPFHFFTLGRAFLQAAYLGVNYEQNLTFLTQAPGPGLDVTKTNITEVLPSVQNMTGGDISQWVQTWNSSWKALPGDTTNRPTTSNSSSPAAGSNGNSSSDSDISAASGTSEGTKIGLGIGLGLGIPLILALVAVVFYYRRRNKELHNEYSKTQRGTAIFDPNPIAPPQYQENENGIAGEGKTAAATTAAGAGAMADANHAEPQEIDRTSASAPAAEMADTSGPVVMSELPADFIFHELPSPDPESAMGVSRGNSSRQNRVSEMGSLLSPTTNTETGMVSPRSDVSPQLSPRTVVGSEPSARRLSDAASVVSQE